MPLSQETEGRLLAKLVRELLRSDHFESLADLVEALKIRCVRLRIHWTNDGLSEAFRLIASNTSLVLPLVVSTRHLENDEPLSLSHDQSVAILAELRARPSFGAMPRVRELSAEVIVERQFNADKRKVLRLVLEEIEAAEQCCAAWVAAGKKSSEVEP